MSDLTLEGSRWLGVNCLRIRVSVDPLGSSSRKLTPRTFHCGRGVTRSDHLKRVIVV